MLFGWWSFRSGKLVGRLLLLNVDGGDSFSLSSWGVLFLLGLGIFFEYFLKYNQKLCKYHIQYNVVLSIFIECKLLWISCWSKKLNAYKQKLKTRQQHVAVLVEPFSLGFSITEHDSRHFVNNISLFILFWRKFWKNK